MPKARTQTKCERSEITPDSPTWCSKVKQATVPDFLSASTTNLVITHIFHPSDAHDLGTNNSSNPAPRKFIEAEYNALSTSTL